MEVLAAFLVPERRRRVESAPLQQLLRMPLGLFMVSTRPAGLEALAALCVPERRRRLARVPLQQLFNVNP